MMQQTIWNGHLHPDKVSPVHRLFFYWILKMNVSTFSYDEIVLFSNGAQEDVILQLQNEGYLRPAGYKCRNRMCRRPMQVAHSNHFGDGLCLRCRNCKKRVSIREGTLFEKSLLPFGIILKVVNLWASGAAVGVAANILKKRKASVMRLYSLIRNVCSWAVENNPHLFVFGGPDCIVQADESVITKRKYNRGRMVRQKWVMGVYDCNAHRGWIEFIPNRSRATMIPVLVSHVLPGTTICTDDWSSYKDLRNMGGASPYKHETVNHSKNFVDPLTGTCTNMVEAYWSAMKRYFRRRGVMQSQFLNDHVKEFIWSSVWDPNHRSQEKFGAIMEHIKQYYPQA